MTRTSTFLWICFLLVLLSGCTPAKKEMPCGTNYSPEGYLIREDEKNKLVYKVNDTINFMVNNAKILTFTAKSIDTAFSGIYYFSECEEGSELYENYIAKFACTDSTVSFPLSVTLYVADDIKPYSTIQVSYRKKFINKGEFAISMDSLVVRGKTYYDIVKVYEQTDTLKTDEQTVIYYNIPYGIIRMKLLGDQFDLIP